MQIHPFSLLVFLTGTELSSASLLRRTPQPTPTSTISTTLQTLPSSPSPAYPQPKVTPPPNTKIAQLVGVLPECNGFVLSVSSVVSLNLASNVSAQLIFLSTAAAASLSLAQASIAAADASASSAIAQVQASADSSASSAIAQLQASASQALGSASAEFTSAQASASSELAAVSASLISAAAIATNSAQAAALALGAAATESAWAVSSQLADAQTAVNFSKATTLPMTVAVVLILGTSFATSVVGVLVYRFITRKRMREREIYLDLREEQIGRGYGGGGVVNGMEKNMQNYGHPHPGASYTYPASTSRSLISASNPRPSYTSHYTNSRPGNGEEYINRDYVEGAYERGDEDNYSTHEVIDIQKEIAEMDYQMKMAEAELERRERERPIRMSESGLSRSSKSISILFTPRGVPGKVEEGERRSSTGGGGSVKETVRSVTGIGIGERLKSIVMPSSYWQSGEAKDGYRRDSNANLKPNSKPNSNFNSTKDREREIGDRELEEGEEIIFALDERPPPLPSPRQTHAHKRNDASVWTLSPSVYDGGTGSSSGGAQRGKARFGDRGEDERVKENGTGGFRFSIGKAF